MPINVLICLLAVIITVPSFSQELPRLQQGEPYAKERIKLLRSGWQKIINANKNCKQIASGFSFETCYKYQEHYDCSGSGLCTFQWSNAQQEQLEVITHGYNYDVLGWQVK